MAASVCMNTYRLARNGCCGEWKGHCGDRKFGRLQRENLCKKSDAWNKNKTLHSVFFHEIQVLLDPESWRWLRNRFSKKETEDMICTVQSFTNFIKLIKQLLHLMWGKLLKVQNTLSVAALQWHKKSADVAMTK